MDLKQILEVKPLELTGVDLLSWGMRRNEVSEMTKMYI